MNDTVITFDMTSSRLIEIQLSYRELLEATRVWFTRTVLALVNGTFYVCYDLVCCGLCCWLVPCVSRRM